MVGSTPVGWNNHARSSRFNSLFIKMKESFKTIAVLAIITIIVIIVLEVVWGIR